MAIECSGCGTLNADTADFCKECGAALEKTEIGIEKKEAEYQSSAEESLSVNDTDRQEPEKEQEQKERDSNSEANISALEAPKNQDNYNQGNIASFLVPMLSSFFATIILQKFIFPSFGYGSYICRLFRPAGDSYQIVVPTTILFLFLWSIMDLLWKMRRILKSQRQLKNESISKIPYSIKSDGPDTVLDKLRKLKGSDKQQYVIKRIYSLVKYLNTTNDVQRSHEFLRHQTDIDSDNAASRYAVLRIFIWAMPILGFIGTVLGIGLAVGDFSGFLTGDIENVDIVKKELSKITGGLSFAFDTTLLGLAASLVAMIATTFVQKSEEGFLTNLEKLGLNIVSNFRTKPLKTESDESLHKSTKALKDMVDQIEISSKGIKEFGEMMQESVKPLSNVPGMINNFSKDVKGQIDEFTKMMNDQVNSASDGFKGVMTGLQTSNQKLADEFAQLPSMAEKYGEFAEDIDSLSGSIKKLATDFEKISEKTSAFQDATAHIKEMNDRIDGFSVAIPRFTTELEVSAQKLSHVPSMIEAYGTDFKKHADTLSKCIEDTASSLKGIANRLSDEKSDGSIIPSLNRFTAEISAQTTGVTDSTKNFITGLQEVQQELTCEFSKLPPEIDTYRAGFREEIDVLSKSMGYLTAGLDEMIQEVNNFRETTQNLSGEFSGLFPQIHENQDVIKTKVREFEEFSREFKTILENNTGTFVKSLDIFSGKVEYLNSAQQTTAQAINSLESLNAVLKEMQKAQAEIIHLLGSLSGPLEIKLFPSREGN